jgi:NADPH2:quinone reductase
MKALLSKAPGGPETLVLEEVPEPQPRRGQARIAVRACGVNFPDVLVIQDLYQFKPPRPFAPGAEVAGVIDAVGEGVTSLEVGDRVIGWARNGGMAEKQVLPEDAFFPIGDDMPFDQAAAFLMTYGTSQHALKDRAALKAGETLLVLGAAGGVGIAAVELGKAYGARVVAAVSSEDKAAFALEHGADATVVYPRGALDRDAQKALSDQFKQACGEGGADVILDPVGGDYAEPAVRSIAWEGRYLVVGFPSGIPKIPLNLTLLKGCQIVGVFWGEFIRREPARHAANVAELLDLYAAGKLRPVVSATYPLDRGGDAIAHLASRKAVGKVVVVI